jgi:hypothetical protein
MAQLRDQRAGRDRAAPLATPIPPPTAGMPSCVAKQVTRPVRNREAPPLEPQLA